MSGMGLPEQVRIPVMRPRLPRHTSLTKYLQVIDESRTYTNFGPLHRRLEERLAEYLGVRVDQVLLCANGTLALQGAVVTASSESAWIMPSWTFVASAEAVSAAAREICFADVEDDSWTVRLESRTANQPHLVVAPFGDLPRLAHYRKTVVDSPLIVDAASCFDACRNLSSAHLDNSMVMVSLHATKLVTTGEGGLLVGDSGWINDVKRWSNFGFRGRRIADVRGTNAKLSEYAAAVGLASLDEWGSTRNELAVLMDYYQNKLLECGFTLQPAFGTGHLTSAVVVRFANQDQRNRGRSALHGAGVETRAWWSDGVHQMATFADCRQREPLEVTNHLAQTTLGLPFFVDMSTAQIDEVVRVLAGVVAS
jgi:dTDP-4-amino-4,6-dideoxygalactose transaminase